MMGNREEEENQYFMYRYGREVETLEGLAETTERPRS